MHANPAGAGGGGPRDAVPLLVPDLPATEDLLPYLRRIDAARWYSNFGPLVREFEALLAKDLSTGGSATHVVALSSGTAALELGLRALGLAAGDRVLLPSFTFPGSALAALRAGLSPVFADVDADRWVLTPALAAAALQRHACRAVMPVAVFGVPVEIEAWDRFAEATGAAVVVDAAAALGVVAPGRRTHVAYSLHATKPLGIGEGGLFATRDPALAECVRIASNFGFVGGRASADGTNAKLSEYAAAVGLAQWSRREDVVWRRARVWERYRAGLRHLPEVELQAGFGSAVPSSLVVTTSRAAGRVGEALSDEGIGTRRWYWPPLHRQPAFEDCERAGELAATARLADRAIGLPFHGWLSDAQVDRVVGALGRALATPNRQVAAGA